MGRMKDLMIETESLHWEWLDLISRIIRGSVNGTVQITKPNERPVDQEEWELFRLTPDMILVHDGTDQIVPVEFKMFRWGNDWEQHVQDAISHLIDIIDDKSVKRGILIVSRELGFDPGLEHHLSNIEIWDIIKLRELAEGDESLAEALELLVSETIMDGQADVQRPTGRNQGRGMMIVNDLRSTAPGKDGWREFEINCEKAIRLLFAADIVNITSQQRTNDSLNRMDLLGRIKTDRNSFWSMVSQDFRSRYVVFDFKNYSESIGQEEIYTTERYLFEKGLRTVAIIISRSGAKISASKAAETTLRESGKFILIISLEDVFSMLMGFDKGEPPENILFERMDEMLMSMGR